MPTIDRWVSRASKAKYLLSQVLVPTLVLTTTGAWYVVGSNFGGDKHPAWSGNLLKQPEAVVTFQGGVVPVRGRLLTDEEKSAVWPRLLTVWPTYDSYAERSGRNLRVFRLEPQE